MANPTSKLDLVVNGVSTTYDIHDANAVPRSGGAVLSGSRFARTVDNESLSLGGASGATKGAVLELYGGDRSDDYAGRVNIRPCSLNGTSKRMSLLYSGSLTWDGTAIQYVSDQRYKQQITEIDDKLLDAWEDVELSQFKYNDAVDEKGKDKARLHTGYVVQQIDNACKKHGVDVSQYGLYCHEEYPEETEEVEVEQADGTKTKERKVIREASEHYSLRYTEVYAVECMYLRRCIERLEARLAQLENPEESQEKGADK